MEQKIKQTIAQVLGIDESEVSDSATAGVTKNWDSLRHMTLILSLEEEFGIQFSDDEVLDLISYQKIYSAIAARR
jgi:acyl carrier protein